MPKDRTNTGGPSYKPADAPVPDRETHRNAQSRDELKERSVHGDRPGRGKRNGSDKGPRR